MQESVFFLRQEGAEGRFRARSFPSAPKWGILEKLLFSISTETNSHKIFMSALLQTLIIPASIHFHDLGSIPHVTNMVIRSSVSHGMTLIC